MTDDRSRLRLFGRVEPAADAAEVVQVFDAARLTQARQLAGMTKAALAAAVRVSAAAVSQWEAHTSLPRPDHLQRLADILDVPVEFFARGRPHARLDASTAHFRSLRSTRSSQRARAIAFVEQVWELTYALEKRVRFPAVDLPGFCSEEPLTEPADSPVEPVQAAQALRKRWGLGDGPVPHLIRTMEMHGIVTTMVAFAGAETPTINAFSTSRLPRPLVVITPDRGDDVYWHRFTAAHELGHLILHRDAAPGDPRQEQEADAFAAEFLTPAHRLAPRLSTRVDFGILESLGREWGVSVKSLIYRACELGVLSEAGARRAYQRLHHLYEQRILTPEPVTDYPGEIPTLLSKAFTLAEAAGILTTADLARELRWSIPRLRLLLGQECRRPALRLV
ncbi:ImmA/IrrE family metallo-endopeptidase [Nocardia paucivorans]|uniref:ImmA/IrrE family metallo-endopeptidase n=1 Tax=Nocardia paucivorans TaxID=114259 RepID=UPI000A0543F6|nr:ImmA/IrrE family metallo-endopeptidase [Nocardia paucivorans]